MGILDRSPLKTIYIISLAHLDIGFTGTQAEVAKISADTIAEAIRLCDADADYKWTIESIWQLEQWMKGKSPEQVGQLMSLVKSGRIGLTAGYAGMLSATMGTEELCRSLYFAERLRKEYEVEINTVIQNDIPGYSWAYPQAFAKSGVKYFMTGVNNFIGAGADIPVKDRPFYWEGPDGSRVMTYICQDPGIKESGYLLGLWEYKWGPGGEAERTVPEMLEHLEEEQYPYDAIAVMAGTADNGDTTLAMTEGAREWNAKHSSPKMVVANPDEFFAHMEKYADRFPVYRGDWSGLWDQGVHGTPYGQSLARLVHDELPSGEVLASAADALGLRTYPKSEADSAWENVITYDEHSGGGGWPGTVTKEQTDEGCIVALKYAQDAAEYASIIRRESLETLAASVKSDGDAIAVWNPLPADRTDLVRIALDEKQLNRAFNLVDVSSGKPVLAQKIESTREIAFLAEGIPGLGYRTYSFGTSTPPHPHTPMHTVSATERVLENRLIRVEVGEDGGVSSILDKQSGAEFVDRSSECGFGRLVSQPKLGDSSVRIRVSAEGPLTAGLIVTDSLSPLARTEITLDAGSPAIRFHHTLDMRRVPYRSHEERGIKYDIAYPLSVPDGRLLFDTPAGLLNPEKDLMPKAIRVVNVHHGGDITGPAGGITFASKQAVLWEFGQINQIWGGPIPPESTELMMRLMEKHDQAEYKEGIGEVVVEPGAPNLRVYETAFMPHDGRADYAAISDFLTAQANPLQFTGIGANPRGVLPAKGQMVGIAGQGICLLTLKKADNADGYVLRLMETAGRGSTVRVSSHLLGIHSAELLDNVENPVNELTVRDGAFSVQMRPREVVTIRLRLSEVRK